MSYYILLCLISFFSYVSSNQVDTIMKYETRISFDLDLRAQLMPPRILLDPHTCAENKIFEYTNASRHTVSNECSSYRKGQKNSLRCDYDFGACDECPCSCENSFCLSFECGDGIINGNEECDLRRQDDLQDMIDPDGCSNNCKIQSGWTCTAKCREDWLECDSVYQHSVNGLLKIDSCNRIDVANVTYSSIKKLLYSDQDWDSTFPLSSASYRRGPTLLSGAIDSGRIQRNSFSLWSIQSTKKLRLRITSGVMIERDILFFITNTTNYDSCPPDLFCFDTDKLQLFNIEIIIMCNECSMYQTVIKEYGMNSTTPSLPFEMVSDEGTIQIGYISSNFTDSSLDNRFANFEWTEIENTVAETSAFQIINLPDPLIIELPPPTTVVRYSDLNFAGNDFQDLSTRLYTYHETGMSGTIKCDKILESSVVSFILESPNYLEVNISSLELSIFSSIHITITRNNHELCPPNNWCGINKNEQCPLCTSFFEWQNTSENVLPTLPMEILSEEGVVQIVINTPFQSVGNRFELEWNEIENTPAIQSTIPLVDTCDYFSDPILPPDHEWFPSQRCEVAYTSGENAQWCIDDDVCDICGCFCGCICLPYGCEDSTFGNRRLLESGNDVVNQVNSMIIPLPIHPRMPILELGIRTQTGIFLGKSISSITRLDYLQTSSPAYRRTSY